MEQLIAEIKIALEEMKEISHPDREHPKEELQILFLASLVEEEER